jgi:hypothetical protein
MKNIYKMAILMTGAASLFVGCGESYQAIYTGQAEVKQTCGQIATNPYTIEMQLSSSTPDVSINVTKFQPVNGSNLELMSNIAGFGINAK